MSNFSVNSFGGWHSWVTGGSPLPQYGQSSLDSIFGGWDPYASQQGLVGYPPPYSSYNSYNSYNPWGQRPQSFGMNNMMSMMELLLSTLLERQNPTAGPVAPAEPLSVTPAPVLPPPLVDDTTIDLDVAEKIIAKADRETDNFDSMFLFGTSKPAVGDGKLSANELKEFIQNKKAAMAVTLYTREGYAASLKELDTAENLLNNFQTLARGNDWPGGIYSPNEDLERTLLTSRDLQNVDGLESSNRRISEKELEKSKVHPDLRGANTQNLSKELVNIFKPEKPAKAEEPKAPVVNNPPAHDKKPEQAAAKPSEPTPKREPVAAKPAEPVAKPAAKPEPVAEKPVDTATKPTARPEPVAVKPAEPTVVGRPSRQTAPVVPQPVATTVKPPVVKQPVPTAPVVTKLGPVTDTKILVKPVDTIAAPVRERTIEKRIATQLQ